MSIERVRRASGKLVYRARYRDPNGKSREKLFDRKIDAERHLASVTVQVLTGAYVDPQAGKIRFGDYARQWATHQPWRQNTRDRVVGILEGRIIERFGDRELRSIRSSEVQAWVGSMVADGLKPSTVRGQFRVLVTVMGSARVDRLISESPCQGVRLPRNDTTTTALSPLTGDQVRLLAETVKPHLQALVLASAGLGLRQGEACGLTLDRVDFLRRKVTIDRQMLTVNNRPPAHGPVKTAASVRSVPLADSVAEILAEHIRRFPPNDSGLLFTTVRGEPLARGQWAYEFRRAAALLKIDATSHDLRHHAASMLISAGCSVKAVQSFLGHATAAETMDTYGHLWPDDEDRIRASIDHSMRASETSSVGKMWG